MWKKGVLLMNSLRHEYKYMINSVQDNILEIKVAGLMSRDCHADMEGSYYIKSLYFDDYDNTCYYENEDGTDPRAKYRIRYYNENIDFLRLEKKAKINGMTYKQSCEITREQCEIFLKGDIPDITEQMPETMKLLFLEMKLKRLVPKVIVVYRRIPFVYNIGNVRITFDKDLCSSIQIKNFLKNDMATRPILRQGMCVLEMKWDDILPPFIKEYLQMDDLQWTNFSKYYLCRKYSLNGGMANEK